MELSVEEFARAIGRLEGKVDAILNALPDHEKRLRSVERWRWMLVGGWTVLGGLFAIVIEVFRKVHG